MRSSGRKAQRGLERSGMGRREGRMYDGNGRMGRCVCMLGWTGQRDKVVVKNI